MTAALDKKKLAPVEPAAVTEALAQEFRNYSDILHQAQSYNLLVAGTNKQIVAKKQSVNAGNLPEAESELVKLEATEKRYAPQVKLLCNGLDNLESEKDEREKRKKAAREELNKSSHDLLAEYQETINKHLQNCNAGFCMVQAKPSYLGGSTSVDYCLEINKCVVPLAEGKSGSDAACFGNTLSEGDKNSLAFASFLAKIERDPDLSRKVAVFDDPVCSLDEHRMAYTVTRICGVADNCRQLVVLSHDLNFAKQMWDGLAGHDRHSLALWKTPLGSRLEPFDVDNATKDRYFRQCDTLELCIAGDKNLRPEDAATCIRPVLEHNLRIRFPREFPRPERVGQFIKRIRTSEPGDAAFSLKSLLSEIEDLYDYSTPDHHEDPPKLNVTELQSYARRVLDFSRGLPPSR